VISSAKTVSKKPSPAAGAKPKAHSKTPPKHALDTTKGPAKKKR
jgi:hypothetical protein